MTGREWLDYFQQRHQDKRKADWLDSLGTALGAGAGFLVGGPPGAAIGAGIGGTVGGTTENAINHTLSYQDLVKMGLLGVSGYGALAGGGAGVGAGAQGLGSFSTPSAMPAPLPFAVGGIVPSPQALQMLLGGQQAPADPWAEAEKALQASQDALGPPPTPTPMKVATHPGWEAVATILGDVLSKLPPPRATKSSNKTIGAYLPAAGAVASDIPAIAAGRRAEFNQQAAAKDKAAEAAWTTGARELANRRWALQMAKAQAAVNQSHTQQEDTSVGNQPVPPEMLAAVGNPPGVKTMAQLQQWRLLNPQQKPSPTMEALDKKVSMAKNIADRVRIGLTDPNMSGYRDMKPMVEAQLTDFNTAQAVLAYEATKTFVKQRESRLTQQQRNSMAAVQKQFALLDKFNQEYQQAANGLRSSLQTPNASVLWLAENGLLGKKAETVSRQLKGQTVLMADQIANIFMAGGVPTDQSLKMAQQVLDATWSKDQISSNSDMVKGDLAGRLAALREARPMVGNQYMPPAPKDAEKEFNW